MNPEQPQNPREELELKITALLLGELEASEAERVRSSINADPELSKLHDQLRQTLDLVREASSDLNDEAEPLRLSAEKRAALLANFRTIKPGILRRPKQAAPRLRILELAAVLAILAILAAILLPALSSSKSKSHSVAALQYLPELDFIPAEIAAAPPAEAYEAEFASSSLKNFDDFTRSDEQLDGGQVNIVLPGQSLARDEHAYFAREGASGSTSRGRDLEPAQGLHVQPADNFASYGRFGEDTSSPYRYEIANGSRPSVTGGKFLSPGVGRTTVPEQFDIEEVAPVAGAARRTANELNRNGLQSGSSPATESNFQWGLAGEVALPTQGETYASADEYSETDREGSRAISERLLLRRTPELIEANREAKTLEQRAVRAQPMSKPAEVVQDLQPGLDKSSLTDTDAAYPLRAPIPRYVARVRPVDPVEQPAPEQLTRITSSSTDPNYAGMLEDRRAVALKSAPRTMGVAVTPPPGTGGSIIGGVLEDDGLGDLAEAKPAAGSLITGEERASGSRANQLAKRTVGRNEDGPFASAPHIAALVEAEPQAQQNASEARQKPKSEPADRAPRPVPHKVRPLDPAPMEKPVRKPPTPQPEVRTAANPFSTFSLNVSDVSFKLAAASLAQGQMPDPATMRSEEFINAFDYRDPAPVGDQPLAFACERARYPFAHNRDLLRFSVQTAARGREAGRPLNLVLLLDNSGSMERSDRVDIIRECLNVLSGHLTPQDKVSVVTFARTARLRVDGVPGVQAAASLAAASQLTPEGGTNLEEAMQLAYSTAQRHYLEQGVNRVVLLTDGAANLGNVDPETLKNNVEAHRKQGIALDCFGIGWEGYNDDLLEVLSRNGDGRYGFVNTPQEASSGFGSQLAGALQVAASDVKVQVQFNPQRVAAYRQIGYAKHQLEKEQFRDNTVDAAEIGAAESGNALYVIETKPQGSGPVATVRARFKVPATGDYQEYEWPVPYTGEAVALENASAAMRLAATASGFSEWLVSSPYAGEITTDRLLQLLTGVPEVFGADSRPRKLEGIIREAGRIAGN